MELTDRIAAVLGLGLSPAVPVTRADAVVFAVGLVVEDDQFRAAKALTFGRAR